MRRDALSLLAEAQFLLARVLWNPHADRRRALRIARMAAKTHPDPLVRAEIVAWLRHRVPPPPSLDDLAIEVLRHDLRAGTDADSSET
ncbi:MAG TPA: hypothetical protein VGF94_29430 [Kofleriaceae bacterium]|jgi:hypothetical protein